MDIAVILPTIPQPDEAAVRDALLKLPNDFVEMSDPKTKIALIGSGPSPAILSNLTGDPNDYNTAVNNFSSVSSLKRSGQVEAYDEAFKIARVQIFVQTSADRTSVVILVASGKPEKPEKAEEEAKKLRLINNALNFAIYDQSDSSLHKQVETVEACVAECDRQWPWKTHRNTVVRVSDNPPAGMEHCLDKIASGEEQPPITEPPPKIPFPIWAIALLVFVFVIPIICTAVLYAMNAKQGDSAPAPAPRPPVADRKVAKKAVPAVSSAAGPSKVAPPTPAPSPASVEKSNSEELIKHGSSSKSKSHELTDGHTAKSPSGVVSSQHGSMHGGSSIKKTK